jgi:hypothetical protein
LRSEFVKTFGNRNALAFEMCVEIRTLLFCDGVCCLPIDERTGRSDNARKYNQLNRHAQPTHKATAAMAKNHSRRAIEKGGVYPALVAAALRRVPRGCVTETSEFAVRRCRWKPVADKVVAEWLPFLSLCTTARVFRPSRPLCCPFAPLSFSLPGSMHFSAVSAASTSTPKHKHLCYVTIVEFTT